MKKLVLLWGLTSLAWGVFAQEPPYVLLVSFDGFRHDYVQKYRPPHFEELINEGASAAGLIPSYPSKTFPNHYTLVTGLVPGNHGLVDNYFFDRNRQTRYGMKDTTKVRDGYYYGGVPIWQLAKENGLKSASFFWVGSELNDPARRPDYFYHFNDDIDPHQRVRQVLDWLQLPASNRPRVITLYFSFPDHEGHEFGPDAPETRAAVLRADTLIGKLMDGIKRSRLPVNMVVVSDHGMQQLTMKESTFIFLDELINRKDSSVVLVNGGTQAHLYISDARKRDSVYQNLKAHEEHFRVWRKQDFPATWRYQHDRVGDLLLAADNGYYLREGSRPHFLARVQMGALFGVHGYDPAAVPDMKGIFYAWGPNIRKGVRLPAIENVHVYPLLAKILGLPLPSIDGSFERVKSVYKK
jgi:alkaline phosphatase D